MIPICPWCQNDSPDLMEWTGKLFKFQRLWVCHQCSKEFTVPVPTKCSQKV